MLFVICKIFFVSNPDQITIPSDVDPNDSTFDCQTRKISSGKFDNVSKAKDRAESFLGIVVLKKQILYVHSQEKRYVY